MSLADLIYTRLTTISSSEISIGDGLSRKYRYGIRKRKLMARFCLTACLIESTFMVVKRCLQHLEEFEGAIRCGFDNAK